MPRQGIPCEARQIIYNVYLYFEKEAKRFDRMEDCYFQKVQERVADACCVSRRFVAYLLQERDTYGPNAFKSQRPGLRSKKKETCEIDSPAKTPKTVTIRVPVYSKPPPLTPLVTEEVPPLTPITTASHLPRIAIAINQNLPPPPLTPFAQRLEMPPLTPLVKSQASSSTLAPPSLIPKKMPPLTPKPQLLVDTLRKVAFETVPIEYEPTDFNYVTIKSEVSRECNEK